MKNLFLITLAILFSFQTTFAQSGRTTGGVVWDLLPGGGYAKQITSEANGKLWVIGTDNTIFSYNGSAWIQYPNGAGLDVAAYNGTPYVIGMDNQIYKGNGHGFDLLPGGGYGKRIAVDANTGIVWVIGMDNTIFSFNGSSWVQYPNGAGLDLVVHRGVPYVIGMDNQIYKGNGSGFDLGPGSGYGKRIAIDATTSKLFVLVMDDSVFELKNNIWTRVGSGYGLDITANRTKIAVVGLDSQLFRTR